MNIKEAKKWIIDNCFVSCGNKLNRWKEKEALKLLHDFQGNSYGEKVYLILNESNKPFCECGSELKFRGLKEGYAVYCSRKCSGVYGAKKSSTTKKEKYKNKDSKKAFLEKQQNTKLLKYGDGNFNNREKAASTCLQRYGVNNPSQSHLVINKIIDAKRNSSPFADGYILTHLSYDVILCLNNAAWLRDAVDCIGVYELAKVLNCSVTTIYRRCSAYNIEFDNTSSYEKDLRFFLDELGVDYITNDRNICHPKELDILIPFHNIAIEMDGIYWHSEQAGKDRNYHLNKTAECEQRGIQLFHIFSNEWIMKNDIWKSVIKNALGIADIKIGARKTICKKITYMDAAVFCDENHLQGSSNSSINYGLFYEDGLVSVMTFSKARFSKASWELQRFCSKKNHMVYGAASKLLKAFCADNNGSIVSYANRRWSIGNLYEKLGFKFLHDSSPNYFWTNDYMNLESRNKYQKHKLESILNRYNSNLTEAQNMQSNGYDRIWDSGNKVYILDK